MAGVLDNVRARPAVLSWITAVAFHVAIVTALPHPKARPAERASRALEVDVPPPPTAPAPPPPAVRPPAAVGAAPAAAPPRAVSAARAAPEL
ncbi:MAG TPA: hypothetical protein VLT33_02985, partial [Labilithrix sp.]|nr:hypothetical protein [Labilithrix sp.]